MSVLMVCALALVGFAPTPQEEEIDPAAAAQAEVTPEEPPVAEDPVAPDWALALDEAGRDQSAEQLAALYPTWVSLVSLAPDSNRPLALILGHRAGETPSSPSGRPALFFGGGGADLHGDELALAFAWKLATEAAGAGPAAELLSQSTIWLGLGLGEQLSTDFPAGWRPLRLGGRGGLTPFESDRARMVAAFVASRRELAMVVRLRRQNMAPGQAWPGAERPAKDRQATAAIVAGEAEPSLTAWPAAGRGGGSFLDWAYQDRGLFSVALGEPGGLALGNELGAWLESAGERMRELALALPRLEIAPPEYHTISADSWCVEFEVTNTGGLPTTTDLARSRGRHAPVRLRPEGARLVAHACTTAGNNPKAPFASAPVTERGEAILAEVLAPGESVRVRLVLATLPSAEGEEASPAVPTLAFITPWGVVETLVLERP